MNKKGRGGIISVIIGIVIFLVILEVILSNDQSTTKPTPKVSMILSFDKDIVKPNEPSRLTVQITNLNDTIIDGNVSVRAIQGSEVVSITTSENTRIHLANKDSNTGLVYTIIGHSSVTVEPYLIAEIRLDNGIILTSVPLKLRIDVNKV